MPVSSATLDPLDYFVMGVYLVAMLVLGAWVARKQSSEDEYFLASRSLPWFAIGLSVIATLLSSLTYLSEPGEVWKSGVTHMWGKMLAIPFEMLLVWLVFIPFLMRFRFTSAYEYLGIRFGPVARRLGVGLFLCLVISWMGFVVLATSEALAQVTHVNLGLVVATVGIVATIYTVMGGMRAVVWTDVAQVLCMLGGALCCIGYVAVQTSSGLTDWYQTAVTYAAAHSSAQPGLAVFSLDPFVRATVFTVALHMFVWHVCTHVSNQMTVQRYFSTSNLRAARRSFVTASLFGVALNLTLLVVGLAILNYYVAYLATTPEGINVTTDVDSIFPTFVVQHLPPGFSGAVLVAMLAAAMSSVDSGINSLATVVCVEWEESTSSQPAESSSGRVFHKNHVRAAQAITLVAGLAITLAAYGLGILKGERNIVEMMPRSFNCFIGSMGGMFLAGIFIRRATQWSVVPATLLGLAASIALAYSKELFGLQRSISFTWVMPGSLLVTVASAAILSLVERSPTEPDARLLYWSPGHSGKAR